MARRVFFIFDRGRDIWRANVVRNVGTIEGVSAGGFHDQSTWEEAVSKGDVTVKQLINAQLQGTNVTVVLIGAETASRNYVSFEIEQSIAQGNRIFGIRVNEIKNQDGYTDLPGQIPESLIKIGAPVYQWEYEKLSEWVEEAYKSTRPDK